MYSTRPAPFPLHKNIYNKPPSQSKPRPKESNNKQHAPSSNTRIILLKRRSRIPIIPRVTIRLTNRTPIARSPASRNQSRRLQDRSREALTAMPGNMAMQEP